MPIDQTPSFDPNQAPIGAGDTPPVPPQVPLGGSDVTRDETAGEEATTAADEVGDEAADDEAVTAEEPIHIGADAEATVAWPSLNEGLTSKQEPETPVIEPETPAIDAADDGETDSSPEPIPLDPNATGPMAIVEALLKSPSELIQGRGVTASLLMVFVACHLVYGLICGSFSGNVQWIHAPLKIILGTLVAGILCLPSLYIFACLSGARLRLAETCQILFGALALTALLLLGFAPVAFIFTFSVQSVTFMGMIHLAIWLTSIGFGIRYVLRGVEAKKVYDNRRLPRPEGNSGGIMVTWAMVFLLTLLQMSTTLRPILGSSDKALTTEKKFFLLHWSETMEKEMDESKATVTDLDE